MISKRLIIYQKAARYMFPFENEIQKWRNSYIERSNNPANKNRHPYGRGVPYPEIYPTLVELGYRNDNPQDYELFVSPNDQNESAARFVVNLQIRPQLAYLMKDYLNDGSINRDYFNRTPTFREALKVADIENVQHLMEAGLLVSYAIIVSYRPELRERFFRIMSEVVEHPHIHHHQMDAFLDPECDLDTLYAVIKLNRWMMYDWRLPKIIAKGYTVEEILKFHPMVLAYYSPEELYYVNVKPRTFAQVFNATYSEKKQTAATVEQIERAIYAGMKSGMDFKRTAKAINTSPLLQATHDAVIERWIEEPVRKPKRERVV